MYAVVKLSRKSESFSAHTSPVLPSSTSSLVNAEVEAVTESECETTTDKPAWSKFWFMFSLFTLFSTLIACTIYAPEIEQYLNTFDVSIEQLNQGVNARIEEISKSVDKVLGFEEAPLEQM